LPKVVVVLDIQGTKKIRHGHEKKYVLGERTVALKKEEELWGKINQII